MKRTLTLLVLSLTSAMGTGCTAGFFMVGSNPASAPPPASEAKYSAPSCVLDGSPIPGPAATYYLASENGAPVLYEIEGGSGARIDNHWADGEGDHFFTYVRTQQGWHYIIPKDRSQKGKRLVLGLGKKYTYDNSTGPLKPIGDPAASCDMVPK